MYNLLIVHVILNILFYGYNVKNNKDEAVYRTIVTLLIPVFGFAFFALMFILKCRGDNYSIELSDYDKYVKGKVSKSIIKNVDVQKEINTVSAKEAIMLNSNKVKRDLLINIVNKNPENHISVLKYALADSDTEISHYAATAITEIKNYYVTTLQNISVKYEKNKKNVKVLKKYIEELKKYLQSDFLDGEVLKKYRYLYSQKLGEILALDPNNKEYFIEKINYDLETNNYKSAKNYCDKFLETDNKSEEPYIMYMKLYYQLRDYNSLKNTLNELKNSDLKFKKTALDITRFWNIGDTNEK